MKVIAVSDSHGNPSALRAAVEQAMQSAPIDVFVHCGDGARDMDNVTPLLLDANPDTRIYIIRGNWDVCAINTQTEELFEVGSVRFFSTHGDRYQVKSTYENLLSRAEALGAKVAFFGHTHRSWLQPTRGIYMINPGAICNRLINNVAYAQVLVDAQGHIHADLMPWLS